MSLLLLFLPPSAVNHSEPFSVSTTSTPSVTVAANHVIIETVGASLPMTGSLWLDAADSTTITIATGVSVWKDKSFSGNNVTQATGANQPTQTTVNGLNSLALNGTSQFLSASTTNNFPNGSSAPFSMFAVFQDTGSSYERLLGYGAESGVGSNEWFSDAGAGLAFGNTAGYLTFGWTNPASLHVVSSVYTGFGPIHDNLSQWQEGTALSYGAYSDTTPDVAANPPLYIGVIPGGGSYWYPGTISEIILFNSALTTTQRQAMEGYLTWKWGLQANLPGGHPYASTAPVISNSYPSLSTTSGRAKTLTVSEASTVTLTKTVNHLSATSIASSSVATCLPPGSHPRSYSVVETSTPTIGRLLAIYRTISISEASTATIASNGSYLRTLTVTQSSSPSITVNINHIKGLSATEGSSPTLSKTNADLRTISIAQTSVATLGAHVITKPISISESSTVTIAKTINHLASYSVAESSSIALSKSDADIRTYSVSQSSNIAVIRSVSKFISVSESSTASVVKNKPYTFSVAEGSTASLAFIKNMLKILNPSTTSVATIARIAALHTSYPLSSSSTESVTYATNRPKALTLSESSVVSYLRTIGINKLITETSSITRVITLSKATLIASSSVASQSNSSVHIYTKSLSASTASTANLSNTSARKQPYSTSTGSSTGLARIISRVISISGSSVSSQSQIYSHIKALSISTTSMPTAVRTIGKSISVSSSSAVSETPTSSRYRIITCNNSSSPVLIRGVSSIHQIASSSSATISIPRSLYRTLTVTSGSTAIMSRPDDLQELYTASTASTAKLMRTIAATHSLASSSSPVYNRALASSQALVATTSIASLGELHKVVKTLSVDTSTASSASVLRAITPTLSISNGSSTNVRLGILVNRAVSTTSVPSYSVTNTHAVAFSIVSSSNTSLNEDAARFKTISLADASVASVSKTGSYVRSLTYSSSNVINTTTSYSIHISLGSASTSNLNRSSSGSPTITCATPSTTKLTRAIASAIAYAQDTIVSFIYSPVSYFKTISIANNSNIILSYADHHTISFSKSSTSNVVLLRDIHISKIISATSSLSDIRTIFPHRIVISSSNLMLTNTIGIFRSVNTASTPTVLSIKSAPRTLSLNNSNLPNVVKNISVILTLTGSSNISFGTGGTTTLTKSISSSSGATINIGKRGKYLATTSGSSTNITMTKQLVRILSLSTSSVSLNLYGNQEQKSFSSSNSSTAVLVRSFSLPKPIATGSDVWKQAYIRRPENYSTNTSSVANVIRIITHTGIFVLTASSSAFNDHYRSKGFNVSSNSNSSVSKTVSLYKSYGSTSSGIMPRGINVTQAVASYDAIILSQHTNHIFFGNVSSGWGLSFSHVDARTIARPTYSVARPSIASMSMSTMNVRTLTTSTSSICSLGRHIRQGLETSNVSIASNKQHRMLSFYGTIDSLSNIKLTANGSSTAALTISSGSVVTMYHSGRQVHMSLIASNSSVTYSRGDTNLTFETANESKGLVLVTRNVPVHNPVAAPAFSNGVPMSSVYSVQFPSEFSASIAKGILGLPNGTATPIYTTMSRYVRNTWVTDPIMITPGELFVLAQLWQQYQSKGLASGWSINYTNGLGHRLRIDFTTEDLKSLFSVVDYAIAGGIPGTLEGEVTINMIDDLNLDMANSDQGSPVGVYD